MNSKMNISQVVEEAFGYWKSTLKYSVVFTLIYYILYAFFINLAVNYSGVEPYFNDLQRVVLKNLEALEKKMQILVKKEEFINFFLLNMVALSILYPLNIGWFSIFSKMDKKEEISLNDLFAGYVGRSFFKYISYFFFWFMIFNYIQAFFVIPAILWVAFTLLVAPIMFFKSEPLGTALIMSFKAAFRNFPLILVGVLISLAVRYGGLLVFLVGYLFTFPFWNAMIYSIYKAIFSEEVKTETN